MFGFVKRAEYESVVADLAAVVDLLDIKMSEVESLRSELAVVRGERLAALNARAKRIGG